MNLSKITILILLSFYSFTAFGQTKYNPIKSNVDKINPVYAFIERASPNGIYKEKVLKTDKEGINRIEEDKTLEFEGYEFVGIDEVVTCWAKKKVGNCCSAPYDECKVWALVEMDLVYTDSIRLYKEQDLVHISSEIFPNPAVDFLNINANSEILQITIFDNFGREVLQNVVKSGSKSIDVERLMSGNYTVQLKFKNGVRSHKFVKIKKV